MADIEALQGRITAALDRIGVQVEARRNAPPAADPAEIARLTSELEEERLANQQLEERVKAIRDKQDGTVEELRRELQAQREMAVRLDRELQGLRKANDVLRESNRALRTANSEGVGEPDLINAAMEAEVEGLRAARAADLAEAEAILSALEPLVAERGQAGGAA